MENILAPTANDPRADGALAVLCRHMSESSKRVDPIDRILSRAPEMTDSAPRATVFHIADDAAGESDTVSASAVLGAEERDRPRTANASADPTTGDLDLEARSGLRRVGGLSTELEDVTEVEYRQLRLENVVLVGVYRHGDIVDAENSLRELALLCETAGAAVIDGVLQQRDRPDPATYLGSGKARELADLVADVRADTVVADTELAPSQRRALEDVVGVKVIDRTAVILDIFSQHAKTREGKAQVELAQLQYLLPRLRGWGASMSRQAGGQVGGAGAGMGSRGPGETKIELDRRRINQRMARLRSQIAGFAPARAGKRKNRERSNIASVAIAGYTNAGKSSLLNQLTGAGVMVQDALFATLDPTVRKAQTPDGRPYTLSDTVGFVRSLPHQLVEAFRSTLEEVADADVIVHVVDGSHPDPAAQIHTVRQVIIDVGARDIPEIIVFNKSDRIDFDREVELRGLEPGAVFVSASTGQGIDALQAAIADVLPRPTLHRHLLIPYDRGDLVALVHDTGDVLATSYDTSGTSMEVMLDEKALAALEDFVLDNDSTPTAPAQSATQSATESGTRS
ncbi:GTP-binding protein HflX [Pontimonas salivibrio]|uniref:GTPase HflX n=2 Tax=Pontimonas salivibrio TaxID=1159327 RepID=A0A2L2BR85_9MICO|nr:GTP-binding protein HflX [Pontimonas salivibrio]